MEGTAVLARSRQPCLAGCRTQRSSSVMVTLNQDKQKLPWRHSASSSASSSEQGPPQTQTTPNPPEQNLLVIFAKFAFDWSNISVIPSAFSGSCKSVSASAVNLVRTNKREQPRPHQEGRLP